MEWLERNADAAGWQALHLAQGKQVKQRLREAGAGELTDAQVKQLQYNAGAGKRNYNTGAVMPQWHTRAETPAETDAKGGWFAGSPTGSSAQTDAQGSGWFNKKDAPAETPAQTDAQGSEWFSGSPAETPAETPPAETDEKGGWFRSSPTA